MAASWLWGSGALRAVWRGCLSLPVNRSGCRYMNLERALQTRCFISAPCSVTIQQCRQSSFFNKLTAEELWKGVLAETGLGAKKGRGKRTKKKFNRNLNTFVLKSGAVQTIGQRGKEEQEKVQSEIIQQRDEWEKRRRRKVKKERGWTGNSLEGTSLGPPEPGPNGETYEDFDSRVIEVKSVFNMTAKEGRKKSIRALVVVGNGNGAAGFAVGKARYRITALKKAKNKAINCLHYVERYQNHTICQDITANFKKTTIQMKKQNKGYGLHCHRAIITICKLIGITDMYAKLSGSNNLLNLTRAIFKGLAQQETHQELADKKGLYVVEFREECGPLPIIVAAPSGDVRKEPEPLEEVLNIKLNWSEERVAQGMKRSPWTHVKRTVW